MDMRNSFSSSGEMQYQGCCDFHPTKADIYLPVTLKHFILFKTLQSDSLQLTYCISLDAS